VAVRLSSMNHFNAVPVNKFYVDLFMVLRSWRFVLVYQFSFKICQRIRCLGNATQGKNTTYV